MSPAAYERPPIIEAICEFRFEPVQPWDWTIPGLVYAEIKGDFPKKREQRAFELELKPGPQEVTHSVQAQLARMQFLREDERAMIQVGENLLAVNHLKPYPQWPAFKAMIHSALSAYLTVAQPRAVRRIGLRYINRLTIPDNQYELEDYISAVPGVPESLPQLYASWAQRVDIPFEVANGMLVLRCSSIQDDNPDESAILLDLDFITLKPGEVSLNLALDWIEQAHSQVERAFESCLTDKSRELFGRNSP